MKNKSKSKIVIGLFGVFGNGNLGCAASKQAMIDNFRCRNSSIKIYGFCYNPYVAQHTHGIPCFPIDRNGIKKKQESKNENGHADNSGGIKNWSNLLRDWLKDKKILLIIAKTILFIINLVRQIINEILFLIESYKILKQVNILMIAGGGQLGDMWGSEILGHSFTILKWSILCKFCNTKFIIFNVGANLIESRITQFIIKLYLGLSSYTSFRDENSKLMIQKITKSKKGIVSIDSAYSLPIKEEYIKNKKKMDQNNLVIGINPIAYCDPRSWYKKDKNAYDNYINNMVSSIKWMIRNGYKVVFIPSQIRMDLRVIKDIVEKIIAGSDKSFQDKIELPDIQNLSDMLESVSKVDIVLACRYHGIILPHLLGKPVLGISYHQKSVDIMDKVIGRDYFIDIKQLSDEIIKAKLLLMIENHSKITDTIIMKAQLYKNQLDRQYNYLIENMIAKY